MSDIRLDHCQFSIVSTGAYLLGKIPFLHGYAVDGCDLRRKLNEGLALYIPNSASFNRRDERLNKASVIVHTTVTVSDDAPYSYRSQNKLRPLWQGELKASRLFFRNLKSRYAEKKIIFVGTFSEQGDLIISIAMTEKAFGSFENSSNCDGLRLEHTTGADATLKTIMQFLEMPLKDDCVCKSSNNSVIDRKNIQDLYRFIKQYHESNSHGYHENLKVSLQHDYLLPSLRGYQAKAVHWMIFCENNKERNHAGKCPIYRGIIVLRPYL